MLDRLTTLITEFEGGWFDLTRRVQTGPGPDTPKAGGDSACYKYLPTRPSRVRQVIRSLQIENYGDFTFIDMGSGKGRVLFVAAERPFRSIQGVEYDAGLHRQAEDNIARSSRKLSRIELHNVDASQYEFSIGKPGGLFFQSIRAEDHGGGDRESGELRSTALRGPSSSRWSLRNPRR